MPSFSATNEIMSLEIVQQSELVFANQKQLLNGIESNGVDEFSPPFKLLPGESVRKHLRMNDQSLTVLTNYRLFVDLNRNRGFYNVLLLTIETVECREIFFLHIHCKDGRFMKIVFDNNENCLSWHRMILGAITPPSKLDELFSFTFFASIADERSTSSMNDLGFKCMKKGVSGCQYNNSSPSSAIPSLNEYSCEDFDTRTIVDKEFARLGFNPKMWRVTTVNEAYKVCSTYPKCWIVPSSISDQDIEADSRYRSLRRVPAVVWRHKSNGSVLIRSSQPESGILCWRSQVDESILNEIFVTSGNDSLKNSTINMSDTISTNGVLLNEKPKSMLILDARSYAAAWANRAKGGGYENAENYQNCEIQFLGLANIHSIRYSFQKLRSLLWDTASVEGNYFQNLDATQWVFHCWALLAGALRVVEAMHVDGRSVLVHCSDGWDRTTQIVSLAKLLLDPYYRTMKGFKELIEREWVAFGHKFAERSGLLPGDINQRSPVFLQWLDCVHYLLAENVDAFEFNEIFLIKLVQHVYSGLFGTFLCNSVAEHLANKVGERTLSIWTYLHPDNCQFRNFLFDAHSPKSVLVSRLQPRDLGAVWRLVYCPSDDPGNAKQKHFLTAFSEEKLDRSLTRALSCDNLTAGASKLGSLDENFHHFHRIGSDSSLTARTKSNPSLHSLNAAGEKDSAIEDSLKSLLDVGMRSLIGNRRHSVCEISNATAHVPIPAHGLHDKKIQPTSFGSIFSSTIQENGRLIPKTSNDIAEPQNSLNASFSFVSLQDLPKQREVFQQSTNESPKVIRPLERPNDTPPKGFLPIDITRSAIAVNKTTTTAEATTANAIVTKSCLFRCSDFTKSTMKKHKTQSVIDLIDGDGLKTVIDKTQQRIRELIFDYEKRLEMQRLEINRLKSSLTWREQSIFTMDGVDNPNPSNGRIRENGEFEPTSLDSKGSEQSWESVEEQDSRPTLWVPDHASSRCMNCGANFWTIKRKHHCRSCGKLFCNDCSNFECPVPEEQFYDPVRVCYKCYETLKVVNDMKEDIKS